MCKNQAMGRVAVQPVAERRTAVHRVVVVALEGVIPFELSIPSRVFGSAIGADGNPLYEVVTCSIDGRPVRTDADYTIGVAHDIGAVDTAGTVVIPAAPRVVGQLVAGQSLPGQLVGAFARLRPATRVVSICTGAYLLAELGLLDGRPATTHWKSADGFEARYPAVRLDRDVLFVDDGNVLTSAGAVSGVDLCLHVVRRDHGSAAANQVARACVMPPWRDGGQAQFIEQPMPESVDTSTAATRQWALTQLGSRLSLRDLARYAHMSVRTFTRRFRAEVGESPNRWLTGQRVELARRLLETTDLPIDRVADQAGLGSAASLRAHFQASVGIPPGTYRRTFRTDGPEPPKAGPAEVSRSYKTATARGHTMAATGTLTKE
jgi:transcriptional regulator GlxA family with amidase domain